MLSLRPITSRAASRFFQRNIRDEAVEVIECGAVTMRTTCAAIALSDEVDRIVGHHREANPVLALSNLLSSTISVGPSIAYCLKDPFIVDGTLLGRYDYESYRQGDRRWLLRGQPEFVEEGTLCSNWVNERYFGHWLCDGLSYELLAGDWGSVPLTLARRPWVHEPGYRAFLGLKTQTVDFVRVGRLWLLDDAQLTDNRIARIERNREKVRSFGNKTGPSHVFISRGMNAIGRHLKNEREVIQALKNRGFSILVPEQEDAATIVAALRSAKVVVSPEGSALAHATMAIPRGATMFVIQPPNHFNTVWKSYSDALGFNFAYTVGDMIDNETFSQPIDRLNRSLDFVESRCGKQ